MFTEFVRDGRSEIAVTTPCACRSNSDAVGKQVRNRTLGDRYRTTYNAESIYVESLFEDVYRWSTGPQYTVGSFFSLIELVNDRLLFVRHDH